MNPYDAEGKLFVSGCIVGVGVGVLLAIFFVLWIRKPAIEKRWHNEAVKKGYAEYYIDKGEAKWRWLDHKEKKS